MSFAFAKETVRKAISAHSALGLVCCALLYLICVTGTAIVLYEEWQRFEGWSPSAPEPRAARAHEKTSGPHADATGSEVDTCPLWARRAAGQHDDVDAL